MKPNHYKSLPFCSSSILCTCEYEYVSAFLSGETGIGKSTLIDTLFNTNFEGHESSHFYPHVRLKAQTYELQESNVRLKLTIVNTVGFGDQINKEERYMFSSSNKIVFFLLQDICLLALCADLTLICRNPCHSSQT